MRNFSFLILIILVFSCKETNKTEQNTPAESLTANIIIDKTIKNACQGDCDHVVIEFTFRDKTYRSSRNGGFYKLERIKMDSNNKIHDVVSNNGLMRFVNEEAVSIPDSLAQNISDGVNSVHYFAQLPYGLNAPSVQKKLLGEDTVKGKDYYEIIVTFSEEGGGTDFDDTFLYWVNKETLTIDYLAYKYATNGGGVRFREAYNPRVVEGIRFVDYNNYKPDDKNVHLSNLDKLFSEGKLKLLSKIETENVKVTTKKK